MSKTNHNVKKISIGFISLGCAKNRVDSQVMASAVLEAGLEMAPAPEMADVVVVNTCAFIDEARAESVEAIQAACELKKGSMVKAVLVAGCLSQRYGQKLLKDLPDVDGFIGLDELDKVAAIAGRLILGERGICEVAETAVRLYEPGRRMVVFSTGPYAYLKIAEGCDHRCAFCAIPGIRGKYRSRPIDSIVREAEDLLARGFRELNLISQDVTSYGRDIKAGNDLPRLIRALGKIGGKFRVRLLYGYPSHVTDELLSAMAATPVVCRYLDLPIQHGHPDVLRAMGRVETADAVANLASRIRTALPGCVVRTTCLLGFPGETEEHFTSLLRLLEREQFDHVGAFVFSPEQDTRAFSMVGRPSRGVAEERRARLMALQKGIVDRKLRSLVGTRDEVMIEKPADRKHAWRARSSRQAPEVDGETLVSRLKGDAHPGDFVQVLYTAQAGYDMKATAIATKD